LLKILIEQNLKNICSHCCCIVTCTRVRRNEDAISIKAGLIKTIENTKSCSDKQNSF